MAVENDGSREVKPAALEPTVGSTEAQAAEMIRGLGHWTGTQDGKLGAKIWVDGRPMFRVIAGLADSKVPDTEPESRWRRCFSLVIDFMNAAPDLLAEVERLKAHCAAQHAALLTFVGWNEDGLPPESERREWYYEAKDLLAHPHGHLAVEFARTEKRTAKRLADALEIAWRAGRFVDAEAEVADRVESALRAAGRLQ